MNQLSKLTRFILALMLALGAIGFSTTIARAAPPDHYYYSYSGSWIFTDLCSFPVTWTYNGSAHEIDFYDPNGGVTITSHDRMQDTYSANGITLVGEPFETNYIFKYDSNGNEIAAWEQGQGEMLRTPGGGVLYLTAGRWNWTLHTEPQIPVDIGNPGDIAALCAALTP